MTPNTLYLGSKSPSRQMLLRQARIPFNILAQDANEAACDWGLPLQQLVESIALHKMEHVIMPQGHENECSFVLTADTLSQDSTGAIHGKPLDRNDAIEKIKQARDGMRTGTAFCLDKKIYKNGSWNLEGRILKFVDAQYQFNIPDHWIERYLQESPGLECSGAIAIEEYGNLFLQSIFGSYSTIVGLPLYELRQSLEQLAFF